MASGVDPVDGLRACQHAAAQVLVSVQDWGAMTPCAPWTAREVVEHLVGGDRMIAARLRGEHPSSPGAFDDLAADQQAAAAALSDAFERPGALEQTVYAPAGQVPGRVLVVLRSVEQVVHGWDVAVSQGISTAPLDQVAEPLVPMSERLLGQLGDDPGRRLPFAPPRPTPPDATPVQRLVALLGRDPGWRPS